MTLGHVMMPCNNDCHFSIDSHVGVLVGDDLALVRHVDLLPLLVGAQDLLRVDVLDHRLVVIAAKLLERKSTLKISSLFSSNRDSSGVSRKGRSVGCAEEDDLTKLNCQMIFGGTVCVNYSYNL